eukprot:4173742-Karenia_brevis.AAC.1
MWAAIKAYNAIEHSSTSQGVRIKASKEATGIEKASFAVFKNVEGALVETFKSKEAFRVEACTRSRKIFGSSGPLAEVKKGTVNIEWKMEAIIEELGEDITEETLETRVKQAAEAYKKS